MADWLRPDPAGVRILLLIQPKAGREGLAGVVDGRLKVRLTAPPVEGQANEALFKFLAKRLGLAKSRLRLLSGHTARRKEVLAEGLSPAAVEALLNDKL